MADTWDRRRFLQTICGAGLISIAGCGGDAPGPPTQTPTEGTAGTTEPETTAVDRTPTDPFSPTNPFGWTGSIEYGDQCAGLAFDSQNRPYMGSIDGNLKGHLLTLRDGEWVERSYESALVDAGIPFDPDAPERKDRIRIAIDADDDIYVTTSGLGTEYKPFVFMYSADFGETWDVEELGRDLPNDHENPGKGMLEVFSGHNDLGRPPVVGLVQFKSWVKERPYWVSRSNFFVYVPEKTDDGIDLGEPIKVAGDDTGPGDCFGFSEHSGQQKFAVTTGGKTHVTFGVVDDADSTNPQWVATIDRQERSVTDYQHVADASPDEADVHSTPHIVADGDGYLHVVTGTHADNPCKYVRSAEPDSIADGWTDPVEMRDGEMTYADTVVDPGDRLHTIDKPAQHVDYHTKRADGIAWSAHRQLVWGPFETGLRHFYHRIWVDRDGAIYVTYRPCQRLDGDWLVWNRRLVVSTDAGTTFQPATTEVFERRVGSN